MKLSFLSLAALGAAVLLAGCGRSAESLALIQTIQDQNQTIAKQQQMLLDQQQSLADQDSRITILTEQLSSDEDMLKQIHDEMQARAAATGDNTKIAANIDVPKSQIVKSLAGFNGRLSASIGYSAYADALSDLDSTTAASLLQVKDQNFVDAVNRILHVYNLGGDFWEKFLRDNADDIVLSQTDRYRYAGVGVTFVDGYHARPPDVRKFWRVAATQFQSLMEDNQQDLGIASTAFQH